MRSRKNPLIPFTAADARALRAYRSVVSVGTKKRAKRLGLPEPTEGAATLKDVADQIEATLGGRSFPVVRGYDRRKVTAHRSYTGKTFIPRNKLLNLEVYLQRHPGKLSAGAEAAIRRRAGRRTLRDWWNIVDSTDATKFEGGETFAATYAPPQTCPSSCSMRGGVQGTPGCDDPSTRLCYAGEHNALQQWKSLWKGYTGYNWRAFLQRLRKTPARIVRLNIAGDLPSDPKDPRRIDPAKTWALALAATARRRTAFTYTHYDPAYRDNAATLRKAMRAGLQVNMSADTLKDADKKADMGFDVAVVLPHISYWETDAQGKKTGRKLLVAQQHGIATPKGRKIFFCPNITTSSMKKEEKARAKRLAKRLGRPLNVAERAAIYEKGARAGAPRLVGKTCATCTPGGPECARVGRKRIVGFLAHGSAGAEKNLDPARAAELLLSPQITPVARREVEAAIARAEGLRVEAAKAAAAEKSKSTGMRHLAVMRANGGKRRRRGL